MEKFSVYNSVIEVTANTAILYNSKEDKCLIFKKEKQSFLNISTKAIAEKDKKFYDDLKSISAIIPIVKNELSEVICKSKDIINNDSEFTLIINPTMNCNFKCWYCYESHVLGSKLSNDTIQKLFLLIDNILRNKNLKRFVLSFFGGEPLMYYDKTTRLIIDYIRTKYDKFEYIDFNIMFTSNGYLINNRILSHLVERNESKHFQITLDGGKENHNKTRVSNNIEGSYDIILNSIKLLISKNIKVLLRINYTSDNIDSINDIINDIKNIPIKDKDNLSIGLFRIWQDDKNIDLKEKNEKIKQEFKDYGFIIDDNEAILDTLINPCYGDLKNELVLNYNGDIYKCTARDFNSENKFGTLNSDGEIDWIQEKLFQWENKTNQSRICQNCRIFPLCGGSCHQKYIESNDINNCLLGFTEKDKDNVILMRLEKYFINNEI